MKLKALSNYLSRRGVRHLVVHATTASPARKPVAAPGLKQAAVKLLRFLASAPAGKKIQQVNEFVGQDPHMDVAMKTLEYRGFIRRNENARCTMLALSDKGKQLIGA
jgi:hypothetical protein